jgi:bifunctional NMN adenylyltransferase/nudix hydrolase
VIGSSNQPRDPFHNPFTSQERETMIRGSLTAEQNNNLTCLHVEDSDYNRMDWVRNVRTEVARVRANKNIGSDISLIGHAKDHTSYYLKLFRPWKSINVKNYLGINASDFRNAYFGNNSDDLNAIIQDALIPGSVKTFLNDFRKTTEYTDLVNEWNIVTRYKKSWEVAPYAPTFVTTDACVIHAGHILLIKRGAHPGKGLWAMPGGFLEQTETVETGTFRELKEETRIKVPPAILKSSLVTTRHFDAPFRSARGRTITFASLVVLSDAMEQPEVRAADDADDCKWWPMEEVTRLMLMEDHYAIIKNLTALI